MYDIIVIGGGPAGLTAALYARRQNKTVLVIEKGSFGGQTVFSPKIENYPGFKVMSGMEFSDKLVEQVIEQGADVTAEEAVSIDDDMPDFKTVVTDSGRYCCKAVVIACGAKHRQLGLEGEERFIGNGISFCAVCDGAFYKNKEVAVIGGGNSALQEALLLSESCSLVNIIQNLPTLTGEVKLITALEAKKNVKVTYNTVVTGLIGDVELTGVKLKNIETNSESELKTDGIFVAIGLIPDTAVVNGLLKTDSYGYIKSDESCRTEVEGVFVAGDCRTKSIRQITTAVSDGASAAIAACKYIENK